MACEEWTLSPCALYLAVLGGLRGVDIEAMCPVPSSAEWPVRSGH